MLKRMILHFVLQNEKNVSVASELKMKYGKFRETGYKRV